MRRRTDAVAKIGTSNAPAREVPHLTSHHSVGLIHPRVHMWSKLPRPETFGGLVGNAARARCIEVMRRHL
ncbi:hypothetical protein GCM10010307_30690 [Streptomyces vastus]|uniref:Uncharacterized protein n=1 Tax=Streptomyces vastus TaxID=285451 RepID=A0ABN3QTM5_9ACTN